jgi:molecular chaperone GrpE
MSAKKKIEIEGEDNKTVKPDKTQEADKSKSAPSSASQQQTHSDTEQTADPMRVLEEKYETAHKEAQDNYDRLLRVSADFENYKKRTAREMEDLRKFANQSLVKDLLPIIDNLELAIKSASENKQPPQEGKHLLDGVELTRKEILKVLEKYNVKQIEALGQPFDPNFHEAVMRDESDQHAENTVINEMQKGYLMHDRLIRPAMVVVAMPKKKAGE